MVEIIWTNHALADLESIASFIAQDSDKYAQLTIRKLFTKTDVLKSFPQSGRVVPEKNNTNIRELIEGNYRIIYEVVNESVIYVLTVHHSSKLL